MQSTVTFLSVIVAFLCLSTVTSFGDTFGEDLVYNGNFDDGNVGYSTDYVFSQWDLWNEGTYAIGTDPDEHHSLPWSSYGDHTTGTGYMMIVNGAIAYNRRVWEQTIQVDPYTDYRLSAWVSLCTGLTPGRLNFRINGLNAGIKIPPTTPGIWEQFVSDWNSGSNTIAVVGIVETTLVGFGNDFALDDISFVVVPEPGMLSLLAVGALALIRRRKRDPGT